MTAAQHPNNTSAYTRQAQPTCPDCGLEGSPTLHAWHVYVPTTVTHRIHHLWDDQATVKQQPRKNAQCEDCLSFDGRLHDSHNRLCC